AQDIRGADQTVGLVEGRVDGTATAVQVGDLLVIRLWGKTGPFTIDLANVLDHGVPTQNQLDDLIGQPMYLTNDGFLIEVDHNNPGVWRQVAHVAKLTWSSGTLFQVYFFFDGSLAPAATSLQY